MAERMTDERMAEIEEVIRIFGADHPEAGPPVAKDELIDELDQTIKGLEATIAVGHDPELLRDLSLAKREIDQLRYRMNTRYWESVQAENVELRTQICELRDKLEAADGEWAESEHQFRTMVDRLKQLTPYTHNVFGCDSRP